MLLRKGTVAVVRGVLATVHCCLHATALDRIKLKLQNMPPLGPLLHGFFSILLRSCWPLCSPFNWNFPQSPGAKDERRIF
jgi:hypothetical protein